MAENIELLHQSSSETAAGATEALHEDAYKESRADRKTDGDSPADKDKSDKDKQSADKDKQAADKDKQTSDKDSVSDSFGHVHLYDSSKEKFDAPNDDASKRLQQVDSEKVQKAAESVHDAMNGLWRSDSDYEKVNKILQGMNDQEKEELKRLYKTKYDVDLDNEFKDHAKDAQQDKALNLLNKKDGVADDAGRVHTALVERHQLIEGRSDKTCEKDIRDTLSTMNSEQIAQLDADYYKRYGKHLQDELKSDDKLSQQTKDAIDIYLKGSDKRTDADTLKLADTALKNKDIEMFEEAMRKASPEARKQFKDEGGEEKMKTAFEGHWYNVLPYLASPPAAVMTAGNVTDGELKRAQDYAKDGQMSTALKLRENTGVVSNTDKAIEQALTDMSENERKAFARGKELNLKGGDESKLSEEDKKALKTYRELHQALEDTNPLDSAKKAKWEDMILHKGGSLVGKLESHHGVIYNDGTGDVKKDIETMSKDDWTYAKEHPQYRDHVLKALQDLKGSRISQDDIDKSMKIFDDKMAAKTYEEAQKVGNRPLVDRLEDDTHWYKNDRKSMVEAITHMSKEEQERYRNDPEFKKKLDGLVKDKIGDGPAGVAAQHMLEQIGQGKSPEPDLIVKMNMRAQENNESKTMTTAGAVAAGSILFPFAAPAIAAGAAGDQLLNDGKGATAAKDAAVGSHSADAVRDMQDEFKKHPELRERILHPKTEEDKKFADDFKAAAVKAMGEEDYQKYARPLLETGSLPIDAQMQLSKGLITNDKDGSYKDILNASPQEKDKILHDKAYQDKVLGYLSDDDRKVALAILEQGKAQPEDQIRAKLNHWGGSDDIMSTLRELKGKPEAIERMKEEYARKYGHDLTADLIDKLSGSSKIEAESILQKQPTSAREAFNDARDQYYQSYDGVGKAFVNKVWDGSGHMTEDAMNQFSAQMQDFSAKFKELPPEQQKELTEKLHKAIDLFIESKGAAADAVVDGVIAVAAVAGAVFTDGVSLGLLAATGAGGAALKVMINSIVMGSDYDWSAKGVSKDAVVGFVNGVVSCIGPGEVGQLLKVGEVAAAKATQQVLKEGAESLIKKGGQELLEKELQSVVRNAVVHGSYEVPEKALDRLVAQVAKEGASDAEKAALKQSLKTALAENLDKEGKSLLTRLATEYGFNMAGGAMGGSSANAVHAMMDWDSSKSVGDNMANVGRAAAMGAVFGAAGGAAFTTVFKVGGSMYHGIAESFHLKPGEKLSDEQLARLAQETGMKDAKIKYDDQGNLVLSGTPERQAMLPPEPSPNGGTRSADLDPHSGRITRPVDGDAHSSPTTPSDRVNFDPHGDDAPLTVHDPEQSPHTVRVPRDVPPEVNEWFNRADIPPEERAALLERVRQNRLAQSDAINGFVSDGVNMSDRWQDLSKLANDAKLNEPVLQRAQSRFFHDVHDPLVDELMRGGMQQADAIRLANDPLKLKELAAKDRRVADFFAHSPERQQALNDLAHAVEVQKTYSRAVLERQNELQAMMDKFAQEHNLPKARIRLVEGKELDGAGGLYQDGTIRLNVGDVLANKDTSNWLEMLYHENVHNQQDSLMIRKLAENFEESMGSGYKLHEPPTEVEMKAIQGLYKEKGLGPLSPEHLKDVLAARQGRKLTDAEARMAEKFMSDWSREGLGPYARYWENINFNNDKLNELQNIGGAKSMLDNLSRDNGQLARQLFGPQGAPADVQNLLRTFTANGGNVDEAAAREILKRAISKNNDQLLAAQQALYKQYLNNAQETEAWIIGRSVHGKVKEEIQGASTAGAVPNRVTQPQGSGT